MTWAFWKKQKQVQNGTGVAIQAGQNAVVTITAGLSATEARAIALDVFKANLLEYRGAAQSMAAHRGEMITDKFIERLQNENPNGLNQAQEPDFQDALFTVQKEYAKAGDEDLGDLLVDLLVDRTKQDKRTMLRIVLNESLHTAPKLTAEQIATLTVVFFIRFVRSTGVRSITQLGAYFEKHIGNIAEKIVTTPATFGHLEYTGCGKVSLGSIGFGELLSRVYPGLFKSGFDNSRLDTAQLSAWSRQHLIIPCLNDPSKLQVAVLNDDILKENFDEGHLPQNEIERLKALFSEGTLSHETVTQKFLAVAPFMQPIAEKWGETSLSHFELTSVGMAIGHANIKKEIGEFASLSIWIS